MNRYEFEKLFDYLEGDFFSKRKEFEFYLEEMRMQNYCFRKLKTIYNMGKAEKVSTQRILIQNCYQKSKIKLH